MNLKFLPPELKCGIDCVNNNFLTEIRIRRGQPVIIQYCGEYVYINRYGVCRSSDEAIRIYDVDGLLSSALSDGLYAYAEQLKSAFVTLEGGVRIGIAGEYVTENSKIITVRGVTSLNVRIPHDVCGCAAEIFAATQRKNVCSVLIFSPPGFGKTTMLRDMARNFAKSYNVLIVDERNEIYASDADGDGYKLGERCDVVRGGDKLSAFSSAIRAMNPQVIVTDELYGEKDIAAIKYAHDCGMAVCASTHVTDESLLREMPFEYFCRLTGVGRGVIIYDKNFDIVRDYSGNDFDRGYPFG